MLEEVLDDLTEARPRQRVTLGTQSGGEGFIQVDVRGEGVASLQYKIKEMNPHAF